MKISKLFLPLILVLVSCFGNGCTEEETPSVKELAVFFIDKTTSTIPDSFIQTKNATWLEKITSNHKKVGTEFMLSYLFANTGSYHNRHFTSYDPPQPKVNISEPTQKKLAKIKYHKRKKKYDARFSERFKEMVFSDDKLPTGSNIIGSLKQLHDLVRDYPDYQISVYYFSDMQECSDFRKMYCNDGKPPTSYQEVKDWATTDFDLIKAKYHLQDSFLDSVSQVTIVLPAHKFEKSTAYELVPIYWKELFRAFGIKKIFFH